MFGQNLVDLRTQTKDVNFSGAASTVPAKSGTSLPATCNPGEMFFNTNNTPGQNLYTCAPANTWTLVGGGASGTVTSGTSGQFGFYPANGSNLVGHTLTAGDIPSLNYQLPLTFTGNGAKTASSTGTLTNNNCAKFDANGNIVDAGSPCANVATGSAGQFSFYSASGNALTAHSLVAADIPALSYQSPLVFTGNGGKVATSTGSATLNNCAKWDGNGNLIDAGAPCGTGSAGVSTFNNRTGAVNLSASDVTTALSFNPLSSSSNLSDLTSATQARTNLGLNIPANYPVLNQNTTGTAATASAFDHNPTGCNGSQFATGISANGTLTCATPSGSGGNVSTSANMASGNVPKATGASSLADGGQAYPASAFVGTSDIQTLTNKSISGSQINSGTVPAAQLPVATSSTAGVVRPDNATITISGGVISAVSSGTGSGAVIQATNGVICGTGTGNGVGCNGAVVGNGSTTTLRDFISVRDYGAVSDGVTDNYASIQNAINAACASTASSSPYVYGQGSNVLLPGIIAGQTSSYRYSKPLVLPCSNLTFEGQGQASILTPSYSYGEALVVRPPVGNTAGTNYFPFPVGPPLVGSSGNSMYIGCGSVTGTGATCGSSAFPVNVLRNSILDLSQVIIPGPSTNGGMGGLSAFTAEAVVKFTNLAQDGYIVSSYGQKGSQAPGNAFSIWYQQAINLLRCNARIGGTDYAINSLAAPAIGTVYALACDYDGSNLRFFINGVQQGAVAATGTLTQLPTEHMTVGTKIGQWPFGSATDGPMIGQIDNIRISNVARYTSAYTPAGSKFVTDANTMALYNFTNQFDAFTQVYGLNGSGWAQFQVTQDESVSFINNVHVKNLTIQQSPTGSGLSCLYSPRSKFENLGIYFGFRNFNLAFNCFESHVDVVDLQPGGSFIGYTNPGEWAMWLGSANGVTDIRKASFYGGQYQLVSGGNSAFSVYDAWFQTESQTLNSVVIDSDASSLDNYNFSNPIFSSESGGTALTELFYVANLGSVLNVQGGYFEAQNTNVSQLMTIDGITSNSNGSGQINLIGNVWDSPAGASEFIKFTSAAAANPVIVMGNSFLTYGRTPLAAAPISNQPQLIITGASGSGISSVTASSPLVSTGSSTPNIALAGTAVIPQIVTSGLIGQYAMLDANGTTLPDSSGNGNNGILTGNPAVGSLGITYSQASAQYATLPPAISSYVTVQVFCDTAYGNMHGTYGTIVGSSTAGKAAVLLDADAVGNHFMPSIFAGGFSTISASSQGSPTMVTWTADSSADLLYLNGTPASLYSLQGGNLSNIGGSIELAAGANGTGTFGYVGTQYYALFYNRKLSASEVQQNYHAVSSILQKRGLLVPAAPNTATGSNLLCDGDSITQQPGVGGVTSYCSANKIATNYPYSNIINLGVSGHYLQWSLYQDQYDSTILNPLAANTAVVFLGTNDISLAGTTPAATHSYLWAHCKRLQQQGWKVVVVTMLDRSGQDANHETYNNLIRANWRNYADALADAGADPVLGCAGCSSNTTYFQDGVHPTQAGQNIVAGYVNNAVNSLGYDTSSNCFLGSETGACSSSTSGTVSVPAGTATARINTSAIGPNSQTFFSYDTALAGCTPAPANIGSLLTPYISARTPGTGFTFTLPVAPASNAACVHWFIKGY
jgi:lysophospholipase L1-like esterase